MKLHKLTTVFLFCIICSNNLIAQKQQYDIVSFEEPKGWNIENGNNYKAFTRVDGSSWAQIAIYKSTVSKGNIELDSKSEWETIVTASHAVSKEEKSKAETAEGWSVMSRSGIWEYNGANVASILTTYSNGKICISILCNATAQPYLKEFQKLISKVSFVNISNKQSTSYQNNSLKSKSINNNHYLSLTTQWDDGWVSRIQEHWTEIKKGNVKIFIFHPNSKADEYNSNKQISDKIAWELLVLPHFTNISSLTDRGMQAYNSITFFTANGVEKSTGKNVHLVLYKKHYDQGNGRYLLVVAENKSAFENEFGNNYINTSSWETLEQSKSWDKLAAFQWRNRFSVQPQILEGTWASGNSSTLSYFYVSTGAYAGATAVSVADAYTFLPDQQYESDHSGASGIVGNQQFSRQQYKGKYYLNDWKITLTNRFQGGTEEFETYFEAVQGGVILILKDKNQTIKSLVKHTS